MAMFQPLWTWFTALPPVWQGLGGGIVIAFLNLVGALLILVWRDPTERQLDGALGFAAGVMISASFTSLILPGIDQGGLIPVVIGMALGILLLDRADAWVPHVHVLVTGKPAMMQRQMVADGSPRLFFLLWRLPCTICQKGWRWVWGLAAATWATRWR